MSTLALSAVSEDGIEVVNPVFASASSLDAAVDVGAKHSGGIRRASATPTGFRQLSLLETPDRSILRRVKHSLLAASRSRSYYVAYFIATVYCLFMDEIRILACPKSADAGLQTALFVTFLMFIVELLVLCWVQPNYFPNTFFWMDLIALLSIIIDIPWMSGFVLEWLGEDNMQALSITRASRAARIGSRAGRLHRLLRISRIWQTVRLLKLSKYLPEFLKPRNNTEDDHFTKRAKVPRQVRTAINLVYIQI